MTNGAAAYYLNECKDASVQGWYQNLDNGETKDLYPVCEAEGHGSVLCYRTVQNRIEDCGSFGTEPLCRRNEPGESFLREQWHPIIRWSSRQGRSVWEPKSDTGSDEKSGRKSKSAFGNDERTADETDDRRKDERE